MQNGMVFAGASRSTHSIVFGDIRAGRDGATRQARLRDLSLMWTRLTDEPEGEVLIALREVKAENAIEAGVILPESGEEQQWLEQTKQG